MSPTLQHGDLVIKTVNKRRTQTKDNGHGLPPNTIGYKENLLMSCFQNTCYRHIIIAYLSHESAHKGKKKVFLGNLLKPEEFSLLCISSKRKFVPLEALCSPETVED